MLRPSCSTLLQYLHMLLVYLSPLSLDHSLHSYKSYPAGSVDTCGPHKKKLLRGRGQPWMAKDMCC